MRALRTAVPVATVVAALTMASPALQARVAPDPTVEVRLEFLREARIVSARPIGKGVTGALRLTLSDGVLTHDASFQSVNQQATAADWARGARPAGELQFVDAYRYNIAAWELARLLGLEAMMPATVERWYRGEPGALSWWVDDVLMDENEREQTRSAPPGGSLDLVRQRQTMQVFAELVRDTDRNKGNVLYTRDWRLVMIDFTRAFRLQPSLRLPETLTAISGDLLERLRMLDRADVKRVAGQHLSGFEVDAMMVRRDLIVERFDALVRARGRSAVLY